MFEYCSSLDSKAIKTVILNKKKSQLLGNMMFQFLIVFGDKTNL